MPLNLKISSNQGFRRIQIFKFQKFANFDDLKLIKFAVKWFLSRLNSLKNNRREGH